MYCRHCGEKLEDQAAICFSCGNKPDKGNSYCPNCGARTTPEMDQCLNCGRVLRNAGSYAEEPLQSERTKFTAGALAIGLGALGVHDFYLGDTGKGWTKLITTVVTGGLATPITAIWALVDAVKIFSGQRDDADGLPLR
ncbi:MAG: TM2 domain-containing protein [Erysipelotrichaceae bacterium]|nr:TM2 domain-containing protein [Erysipelotrichaceae bacterium]MBO4537511.1 TM2 domain-containing protein [Erysipelotrichaceae bacterium]MBR5048374.1 TM2 domain-containing protein [Erysipelotrichaceae bacterium]